MTSSALCVSLLALALVQGGGGAGFEVVVHPAVEVRSITRGELSKIFLKRLRSWSDGTPTRPVDQEPGRPVRTAFSRQVHERSIVQVEVYWKRMIFSGRSMPPPKLPDDEAVLAFVRQTPGAVGYVSPGGDPRGVRKLVVEP